MTDEPVLLHRMARNYLACVYPFPNELKPEHLDAPDKKRLFDGLHSLHRAIRDLYEAFTRLEPANEKALSDEDYCWKVMDGSVFLLWTLGVVGERVEAAQGVELRAAKPAFATSAPGRKVKEIEAVLPGLHAAGFRLSFLNADGSLCATGWKGCGSVGLGWQGSPAEADAMMSALVYFAGYADIRKPGVPFEVFKRADFRCLLPDGDPAARPYTFEEALNTLDAKTSGLWREMASFLAQTYPKFVPFFRHPDLRRRIWAINYDTQPKGYGLFTLYGEDGGFWVRMAFKKDGRRYVLDHIEELSPRMQEMFLNRTTCVDCKHCGEHEFYPHQDHVHKLCAGAWFYSLPLEPEDLPSVQRLIAIHIAHQR